MSRLYVYDNYAGKIAPTVSSTTENWFVWMIMVYVNYMEKSGFTPQRAEQYIVIFRTILLSHNNNWNHDKSI